MFRSQRLEATVFTRLVVTVSCLIIFLGWGLDVQGSDEIGVFISMLEQELSLISSGRGTVRIEFEGIPEGADDLISRWITEAHLLFEGERILCDSRFFLYTDGRLNLHMYHRDIFDGERWISASGPDSIGILTAAVSAKPQKRALQCHPQRWTGLLDKHDLGVAGILKTGVQNGTVKVVGQEDLKGERCTKVSMNMPFDDRIRSLVIWLAQDKSYLPLQISVSIPEQEMVCTTEFLFKEVGGGIWLLKKGTSTITKDEKPGMRLTYELSDDFEVNKGPYPELRQASLPPGTKVFDARTEKFLIWGANARRDK